MAVLPLEWDLSGLLQCHQCLHLHDQSSQFAQEREVSWVTGLSVLKPGKFQPNCGNIPRYLQQCLAHSRCSNKQGLLRA